MYVGAYIYILPTPSYLEINDNAEISCSIAPNPFTDYFILEANKANDTKIEIYDTDGKLIFTSNLYDQSTQIHTIKWSIGMYILKFAQGKNRYVKKIVKQ